MLWSYVSTPYCASYLRRHYLVYQDPIIAPSVIEHSSVEGPSAAQCIIFPNVVSLPVTTVFPAPTVPSIASSLDKLPIVTGLCSLHYSEPVIAGLCSLLHYSESIVTDLFFNHQGSLHRQLLPLHHHSVSYLSPVSAISSAIIVVCLFRLCPTLYCSSTTTISTLLFLLLLQCRPTGGTLIPLCMCSTRYFCSLLTKLLPCLLFRSEVAVIEFCILFLSSVVPSCTQFCIFMPHCLILLKILFCGGND